MYKMLLMLWIPALAYGSSQTCTYDLDAKSLQVQWTAFKTSEKVPVAGGFSEVSLSGTLQNADLAKLLGQLAATIPLSEAKRIVTGNPPRDQTLYDHFFSLIQTKSIKGSIQNVKLQKSDPSAEQSGSFDLKLTLHRKTRKVPFQFTLEPTGALSATASINVLDFSLGDALAALHKACGALHTGADNKSKTWPDVDLKISAKVQRGCKGP